MTDAAEPTPAPKPKKRRVSLKKPDINQTHAPSQEGAGQEPSTAGTLAALIPPRQTPATEPEITGPGLISRVFLGCVLAGGATALLGIVDHPVMRWFGFVGPIVATLFYPLWGVAQGLHKRPSVRERFADNAYYLGFIFTQISLVVGFLPTALFNRSIESKDVLQFFGIALGASLIGLVSRTLLTQTGNSIPEAADIVEREVEALAKQVTTQSKLVLGEFEGLASALSVSQRTLAKQFETSMAALNQTVLEYDRTLRHDLQALEGGAASMLNATQDGARDLAAQSAGLASNLNHAAQAVVDLKQGLHAQVSETSIAIRATADALARGVGAIQGLAGISDQLGGLDRSLSGIGDKVDHLDSALSQTQGAARASIQKVEDTVGLVQSRAQADVAALSEEMEQTVSALETTLKAFRAELDRLRV